MGTPNGSYSADSEAFAPGLRVGIRDVVWVIRRADLTSDRTQILHGAGRTDGEASLHSCVRGVHGRVCHYRCKNPHSAG
jgi:hypothetical protein